MKNLITKLGHRK